MLELYCKAKAVWATRDRGASAAEYAMLIAFIAAILVTVVVLFRGVVQDAFESTCDALQSDSNGAC